MIIDQLYIRETEIPDGPYDMMAIIRKIRNGAIKEETLVSLHIDQEPVAAASIGELAIIIKEERFDSESGVTAAVKPSSSRAQKSFSGLLFGVGLEFLKDSIGAAIYSGVFMLIWIIIGATMIYQGSVMSIVIGIMISYFFMGGYLFGVLRYVRGNPVSVGQVIGRMKQTALPMAILSIIVGMLMLPGVALVRIVLTDDLVVISLPILFMFLFVVMTFFAFAPLLIVEKGQDFLDAICASYKVARSKHNIGIVFGLIALNFILLFLMPIVLPMTMGALAELYDEHFAYG